MTPYVILPSAPPPVGPVYRIGREPNPCALVDWKWAAGGRFGGRWDDPSGSVGVPPEKRFRVTYVTTTQTGAYGETIGQWANQGRTPKGWDTDRLFGEAVVTTHLPFVDMTSPEITRNLAELPVVKDSLTDLNRILSDLFRSLNLPIVPLQADDHLMASIFRPITQEVSRYIYDLLDPVGNAQFAGIKYLSHHPPRWECWAIYEGRAQIDLVSAATIDKNDPSLQEAADQLGIVVE